MKKNIQALMVMVVLSVLWLLPGCGKPSDRNGADPATAAIRGGAQPQNQRNRGATPEDPKKQGLNNGPITDGGGNAVGGKLFDFYENEGTTRLEIKSEFLDNEENRTLSDTLNEKFRALDARYAVQSTGQGLGRFLISKMASDEKKWMLEPKEIDNKSCLNRSMVDEKTQKIVACQSANEIRISEEWFKTHASPNDRAGLIAHETVLMVVQKSKPYTNEADKVISEQLVREITRQIFETKTDKEMISLFKQINVPIMTALGQNLKLSIETEAPAKMCAVDLEKAGFALTKKNAIIDILLKAKVLESELITDEDQKRMLEETLGFDPLKLNLPSENSSMTAEDIKTFCSHSKIDGAHPQE